MPDKQDIQIGEEIRRIAGRSMTVLSGVVKAVSEDETECTVALTSGDDSVPVDGVLLNVATANGLGLLLVPAVNADCLVAEVDGAGAGLELIRASAYTKVVATTGGAKLTMRDGETKIEQGAKKITMVPGGIKFNEGVNDGLMVGPNTLGKINALENDINTLKSIISTWIPAAGDGGAALKLAAATWYAAPIILTTLPDIINNEITH